MPDYRKNKYEDLENILNEKIGCYSDLKLQIFFGIIYARGQCKLCVLLSLNFKNYIVLNLKINGGYNCMQQVQ